MYSNGKLPDSVLAPIAGGKLRKDAAKAFNAMNRESQRKYGVTLRPTGPMSSYRTYAQQVYLWNLYKSGRGNLAATPGGSNHGLGLAIDLATPRMRTIVDMIGEKYGWAKKWSDAPNEWWHLKYKPGVYKPVDPLSKLTKEERKWVREYLKLKKANKNRPRRIKLRALMRQRRKRIYKVAQKDGWNKNNRKARWTVLRKYS